MYIYKPYSLCFRLPNRVLIYTRRSADDILQNKRTCVLSIKCALSNVHGDVIITHPAGRSVSTENLQIRKLGNIAKYGREMKFKWPSFNVELPSEGKHAIS